MDTCIICRIAKKDSDFSLEHIIPQYLGGTLETKSVCRSCNNTLGTKVDSVLIGFLPIKHARYKHGLSDTHSIEGEVTLVDSGRKGVAAFDDKTGTIQIKSDHVDIKVDKDKNTITAHGSNEQAIKKALDKKMQRMGLTPTGEETTTHKETSGTVKREDKIDTHALSMFIFKISLEAIHKYQKAYYFSENEIEKIRAYLDNYLSNNVIDEELLKTIHCQIELQEIDLNKDIYNKLQLPVVDCISCVVLETAGHLFVMINIFDVLHTCLRIKLDDPLPLNSLTTGRIYVRNFASNDVFEGSHHEWLLNAQRNS